MAFYFYIANEMFRYVCKENMCFVKNIYFSLRGQVCRPGRDF